MFEPLRKPINDRAAAFRHELLDGRASPSRRSDCVRRNAFRRPLAVSEANELRELYRTLAARRSRTTTPWRLVLARVLVSPRFLYRLEKPAGQATSRRRLPTGSSRAG